MQVAIGIDIGGTGTKLGLVTREGRLLSKSRFSTRHYPSSILFLDQLKKEISQLLEVGDYTELVGIGLGAPKANYFTGIINGAANLSWDKPVEIQTFLQERFQVNVRITNDANLAALGEKEFGHASRLKNFLSVTLGTGLGCGIFVNGCLQHGESDLAGELGHTTVKRKGRECNCGKRGCLEAYVSANGMVRTAHKVMSKYKNDSLMRNMMQEELTPAAIDRLAEQGDALALKVIEKTADILGYKLSDMVAMYNPEAIILAGGIANCQLLYAPTLSSIKKYIYKTYDHPIKLMKSAFKDDELAVLGAGALIWRHLEEELKIVN
ncbi:glucokinase [Marivirga lumbricoides]|uniref:Glucokinase n=1 Tax=Marivirga lumbricoides TaxID=1046115 RepID=A0ABQ1NCR5_9BACT|nr:glucokinase [Marivirga lumbricoides]